MSVVPSAPARAAIISLEGSLRPRSISDRYCGEIPARAAVSDSVCCCSWRRARSRLAQHFPPERLVSLALLGTRFRLRFPLGLFPLGFASQRIHVRVLGHTSA
jgi:hypothetical protein